MAYEVVMSYHLHMPSYFLGTFTEYPYVWELWKNECSYLFSVVYFPIDALFYLFEVFIAF